MKYKIDHIGVAVASINDYLSNVLSIRHEIKSKSEIIIDLYQDVRLLFVEFCDGTRFELIQPNSVNSPVSRILKKNENPVYHIGYKVPNIDKAINFEIANGGIMLGKINPAIAFDNKRIVFIYTGNNELIELIES